ncbi:hypothetical protein NHH03_25495 [Stieleria sp. TO1_6]|uniref:hypothetical protein n=1 Tax=Stieleria tagensis TaxID=2956795 RepID=UPI00209AA02C|nr:hypothetical protein [Stieleria tagensis]MCO8125116.1 hypothetical protein [Stieleria tagensis]
MRYEFISLDDSIAQTGEFIMTVWCRPPWWMEMLGILPECIAFAGHEDQWKSIDGTTVTRREREMLAEMWRENYVDGCLEPEHRDLQRVAGKMQTVAAGGR